MASEESLAEGVMALVYRRFGIHPDPTMAVADVELDAAEQALGVALPRGYRVFLRHFGSLALPGHDFVGLPRNGLRHDIVFMNHLGAAERPARYVTFSEDGAGRCYFFDTARRSEVGECPVIVRDDDGGLTEVAGTFLEFLSECGGGAARRAAASAPKMGAG